MWWCSAKHFASDGHGHPIISVSCREIKLKMLNIDLTKFPFTFCDNRMRYRTKINVYWVYMTPKSESGTMGAEVRVEDAAGVVRVGPGGSRGGAGGGCC